MIKKLAKRFLPFYIIYFFTEKKSFIPSKYSWMTFGKIRT
jgi:hypothetical protein